jgi:hypothetical protein
LFVGGVVPSGLAQRLPEGILRTTVSGVLLALAIPTTGFAGALIGGGYDLGRGVFRAVFRSDDDP